MSVMRVLLGKELLQISRTWRLPTVGGALLFFAVMSPLAALVAPALIGSLTSGQPGVVIRMPDPTYVDSYAQWVKNLSQIGTLLVVFASAGLLAGERTGGTAALVVTKPVSRGAFVVSKFLAQALLVVAATALGTLVVWAGTLAAFGTAPAGPLVTATVAWLAGALVAIALTEVASAVVPALAAGALALGAWALAGILAVWAPAALYTPVGLLSAPGAALSGRTDLPVWPLLTGAVAVAALVWLAASLFARREL